MRKRRSLLELRAAQLPGITHIPHAGTSLAFALFIEELLAATLPTLIRVHKELFFLQKEGDFLDMVDQIRASTAPAAHRTVCFLTF